jgi:hypothetical protein
MSLNYFTRERDDLKSREELLERLGWILEEGQVNVYERR